MTRNGYSIEVGCDDDLVVIVVHGAGNLFNSYPLQDFLVTAFENAVSGVIVNLADCRAVDSTFMGVMAGLSHTLADRGLPRLRVANATAEVREALQRLGITYLVDMEQGAVPCASATELLEEPDLSKLQRGEHMLEAHERLMALSEENHARFASLISTLQANIAKHRAEG